MTAAILAACGCWVGRVANSGDVRKCSYENIIVSDIMRKAKLAMGLNPDSHAKLPSQAATMPLCIWLEGWLSREFSYQGHRGEPWLVKSSSLVLVWPIWARSWPNAKWVIVRRDNVGLVRAAMTTHTMFGRSGAEAWLEWAEWYERELNALEEGVQYKQTVWPTKFAAQKDFREIKKVVAKLKLEWNDVAVTKLFESKEQ